MPKLTLKRLQAEYTRPRIKYPSHLSYAEQLATLYFQWHIHRLTPTGRAIIKLANSHAEPWGCTPGLAALKYATTPAGMEIVFNAMKACTAAGLISKRTGEHPFVVSAVIRALSSSILIASDDYPIFNRI